MENLKLQKFKILGRRNEPLIISGILERFVREGNVCLFQLGNWIKYGMLVQSSPKYKTDSEIDWEIRIMVIGDKNPITGESFDSKENDIARIFSSDSSIDPTTIVQEFAQQIDANRKELEQSYLPKVTISEFFY